MLNLSRLQVLCEVVNRGSFSAAADALAYTQSAVSQAVARLEAETGTPLVIRDRRGIRPTAAGTTLVAHAEAIFAQVEAAEADLAAVLGIRAGRLRVASFPSAGATLMPLAVARFLPMIESARMDGDLRVAAVQGGEITERMEHTGHAFRRGRSPQIMRAFRNLGEAVRLRMFRGDLTPEQITKIADAIDNAARTIDGV